MQSGLVYGHMGLVEFIVRRIKKELAEYCADENIREEDIKVIATGGLSTMIDQGVDCIDYVDKLLTLEGLELIYRKNKKNRKQVTQEEIEKTDMLYEGKL
jgi:type III pantothenate kinase